MSKVTCVCNNCSSEESITHYSTCRVGECQKWIDYYDEHDGNVEYPDRPVGEIIEDNCGEWRRTNRRDMESTYPDNYYYMPMKCYCDVDFEGTGYTFNDEYGACDYCEHVLRQINGHNDDVSADFDDPALFA